MPDTRPLRTAILALLLAAGVHDAAAQTGSFTTLSYNIAGLLEPFSGGNPAVNTPIISCLIRDYTIVQVQEDFNYHAALYDSCDNHLYRSPTSGGMGIGSGLNTLSNLPYMDFGRITWNACDGVDCLTPKGFTLARTRLAEGVYVDVYNLHAQAETTEAALAARRANILHLARQGQYNGQTRIFYARFTTSTNRTLAGGATTGSCTTYTAPTNWQIVGFHGRSGANVDKLGVIYAPRGTQPAPGPAAYAWACAWTSTTA